MQEIDRRIDGVALLSETERTSLSLRRLALDSAKDDLALRLERQRDRKRQAERRAELVALVSRAQGEHHHAAREVAAAQSTKADVLKALRVRPLRPMFEAQQKVDARVESARLALAACKTAESTAQLALDGANEERTRAIAAFEAAERSHQANAAAPTTTNPAASHHIAR